MNAALLALAIVWVALGIFWLVRAGPNRRTRSLRRFQGALLIAGGALLGLVGVVLARR